TTAFVACFLSAVTVVSGHARIAKPVPLGYGKLINGNAYNRPLNYDGSDFPCKGLIDKQGVNMATVATWEAGKTASFEIQPNDDPSGGEGQLAAHSGGSCQASISFDRGKSFKVLHTYNGGCPRGAKAGSNIAGPDQKFDFMIPAETKAGDVLFSWSWIANTGNRGEFYQNCASVKITGSGTSTLTSREDMWVGDLVKAPITKTMCLSTGGKDFRFPNPGDKVTNTGNNFADAKGPGPDGKFDICRAPGSPGKTPETTNP
ncbi:hypothetical protein DFH27DRAFT_474548, partial [Peziza echinospora]